MCTNYNMVQFYRIIRGIWSAMFARVTWSQYHQFCWLPAPLCFHICWFVSLSVCQFVCLADGNITGKHMDKFSWIFLGYVGQDKRKKSGKFEGGAGMFNPLQTRFLFIFLQGNHFLWATLRKNGRTDFHEIVRKVWTWDKEQFVFSGCCG